MRPRFSTSRDRPFAQARAAGHVASLLDQERPNVFTQSVANVEPGVQVVIEISYVETLKYEDGNYEFVFPMTVGPRYIPGSVNAAEAVKKLKLTPQTPAKKATGNKAVGTKRAANSSTRTTLDGTSHIT